MVKKIILYAGAEPPSGDKKLKTEEVYNKINSILTEKFYLITKISECRINILLQALRNKQISILIFNGHGSKEGLKWLNDAGKYEKTYSYDNFINIITTYQKEAGEVTPYLECAVVLACETRKICEDLSNHVYCVIGTEREISPEETRSFAENFFGRLQKEGHSDNEKYEQAFQYALIHLTKNSYEEWVFIKINPSLKHTILDDYRDTEQLEREPKSYRQIRKKCCDRILNLHRKIRLFNQQQIDVDKIFVDVYIHKELKDQIPPINRNSIQIDKPRSSKERERVSALKIAKKFDKLMILGKPGSGKTTLLKHLAILCCQRRFRYRKIPILIELRNVNANSFNLLQEVQKAFDTNSDTTQKILDDGQVLLLLDGLDEVPSQFRDNLRDKVEKFIEKYPKNIYIISCRNQTPESNFSSSITFVEIADFNLDQIKTFIKNWLKNYYKDKKDHSNWLIWISNNVDQEIRQKTEELFKEIQNNRNLRDLTVTPLLLSLICYLYIDREREGDKWSKDRAGIYQEATDKLLYQSDKNKGIGDRVVEEIYKKLKLEERKALLSYLALKIFEQPDNFIEATQNQAITYISEYFSEYFKIDLQEQQAEDVLRAIELQHGFLIEFPHKIWSFQHRTFQEYFAAQWMIDKWNLQKIANLVFDSRWHNVLSFVVEMHQSADQLLFFIKQAIDNSVADNINLQELLDWAARKAESVQSSYQLSGVRALYLGIAQGLRYEFDDYLDLSEIVFLPTSGSFLAHKIDPRLQYLTADSNIAFDFTLCGVFTFSRIYINNINFEDEFVQGIITLFKIAINQFNEIQDSEQNKTIFKQLVQMIKEFEKLGVTRTKGWIEWINKLHEFMIEHRQIKIGDDWQLTEQTIETLENYLSQNHFILNLLNRPSISDDVRQNIKDGLLLPQINSSEKSLNAGNGSGSA